MPNVQPHAIYTTRQVPISEVKEELQCMETLGVISRVQNRLPGVQEWLQYPRKTIQYKFV